MARVRGKMGTSVPGYGDQVVDQFITATGDMDLRNLHERWSGSWYGSSAGARNKVGLILQGKHTDAMLKDIASSVSYSGPIEKIPVWVRRKYAGTQAVLEARDKKSRNQREWMFLSRGIAGGQGKTVRKARLKGGKQKVALRSVSSWSSKRSAAVSFAGYDGVVLRAAVHRSRVFSQFEQESVAWRRFGDGESEYIVISTELGEKFDARDLENPRAMGSYGGEDWDTKKLSTHKSDPDYKQWLEKQ